MMRYIITALFSIIAVIPAIAQEKKYVLEVGDFTELTVAHSVNVEYSSRADSVGYAVFYTSPAYASSISFDNRKGKLKIEIIADAPVSGAVPTVTIYSKSLVKATNLADSTVTLKVTAPVESISLKVIGNGTVSAPAVYATKVSAAVEAGSGRVMVGGKASDAKFTLASTGTIEASSLDVDKVKCWMFGTGAIDCKPKTQLTVMGATSGTVYYKGNPEIKKRSIGAKLVRVDD